MSTDNATNPVSCRWCGMLHGPRCHAVAAMEFHPDGSVKRVEFASASPDGGILAAARNYLATTSASNDDRLVPPNGWCFGKVADPFFTARSTVTVKSAR